MKLLVSNRGEIARRIFRSARALGIETVAVYSDADANSMHVREADSAFHIGSALARESYLDMDRVLTAAIMSNADLIHPGYGFLSENAEFADLVAAAGIMWIGPAPDIIRTMGDKQRAREIAETAGVPVTPGSRRFDPGDVAEIDAAAEQIGFPLLVKASAGGGGIGMQRVDDAAKLRATVSATQSMAEKAFGDGSIFLERLVPKARHIEIQIFGFGDGTAIHLFERDCSLQRRFQKVIEESPAPGLPEAVLNRMQDAALSLCKYAKYQGAGTVEFIVDAETFDFFFLEMNTRVQVEHPVTEMLTGMDIVRMQINQALGKLEKIKQENVKRTGHAIECRIYAERPAKMFMPSPGQLSRFRLPRANRAIRIDTGYAEGDMVTPYYDPMIAKLIVSGDNREDARRAAIGALEEVNIEGISSNRNFLIASLSDDKFAEGDVYTRFIDDHYKELTTDS